jgi:hypothetical protein
MKSLRFFCLLATVILAFASCEKDVIEIDEIDKSEIVGSADDRSPSSTVAIYEDPDGPPETFTAVAGAFSNLKRNANGITANFKTNGLIPGNAYTMWFVIFGDAPGPPVLVTYAAGHVVGNSGKGNFSAHISVGDIFDNPLTAEVHLALRTHGPAQPDMMPDQIHTIDGGCLLDEGIGYPSGPALYADSDLLGYCANVQVAMHPAN